MSDPDQSRGRRRPPSFEDSRRRTEEEPKPKHFRTEESGASTSRYAEDVSEQSTSRGGGGGGVATHAVSASGSVSAPPSGKARSPPQRGGKTRDRYEIVHTRPADVLTKKGTDGKPIRLKANYFRLKTTLSWNINQYVVDFEPEIENRRVRGGILSEHRQILGGYLYDGRQLFSTTKLEQDKTILKTTSSKTNVEYIITIKRVGLISMTEWQSLQVLNLIMRRAMEGLKLQLVGRNLYDPHAKIDMREYNLQLWPGYETSVRQHERDILLCSELTHKVMRTETLYDIMNQLSRRPGNFQEEFRRAVIGIIVLTDYNNKTYRVNDVDFAQNPNSTFECKGKPISFKEYYYQRYHIRIRDSNQPLLISKSKDKAQNVRGDEIVILVPELCRATGLTDDMRSNFRLMRDMGQYTRMKADRRIQRLEDFNRRLQRTPDSINVLKEWNMKLDDELLELPGRVLSPENIVFADKAKFSAGERADWTMGFRSNKMYRTPSDGLYRWAVVAQERAMRDLSRFLESLYRAANGMGFKIQRPVECLIRDDRNSSYCQALDECSRRDPQMIMCLVPNNNVERYNSIKKKVCLERPIPTQVLTMRVVTNQKGAMSIATKVAIQMNAKLGYMPWTIQMPTAGLMTVGIDIVKSTRDRSKAYCALVATMDIQTNSTFFSTVVECSAYDLMANSLWPMLMKALRRYRDEHKSLPTRIIFYRDGVSSGSLKQVYEHEVKEIVEKLNEAYKNFNAESEPRFAYIVVTKSLNTRFFQDQRDPPPGTIVDDVITLPECYDFYLVSQFVTQGTVSPTRYNVLFSNVKLTPDKMQRLTFKMTHLYYNWSGTTRVPSVCQYAKKLATLVATNLHQIPHSALEKKFYYL